MMLSMRDDEFIFDEAHFDYFKLMNSQNENMLELEDSCQSLELEIGKDVTRHQSIFQDIRAFSYHWPYVACTGIGNYLLLIDAYENKLVKRI